MYVNRYVQVTTSSIDKGSAKQALFKVCAWDYILQLSSFYINKVVCPIHQQDAMRSVLLDKGI